MRLPIFLIVLAHVHHFPSTCHLVPILGFPISQRTTQSPKPESKKSTSWSDNNEGKMIWQEAKSKCESLEMSLPTSEEGKTAYKTKITKSWKSDGIYYWTNDEASENKAFSFDITDGVVFPTDKHNALWVRCVQ